MRIRGIQEFRDPVAAIQSAQCICIPGGNAFALLKDLYEQQLIEPIRQRVLNHNIPCVAVSAGATVTGRTIHTSNNMAIVQPPRLVKLMVYNSSSSIHFCFVSFIGLNLVPFNINPHYPGPNNTRDYTGSRRDTDLRHFIKENQVPVVVLEDTAMICVDGDAAKLIGEGNGWLIKT